MEREKTSSIARFMDLPAALEESAKYEIILCPYEESTGYLKGTGNAPYAVLEESRNIEPYDRELGVNAASEGISTRIVKDPRQIKGSKHFSVVVGGEHTLSYYASRDFRSLVVFDAHLDLLDSYGGKKLAHATWLRRALEEGKTARVIGARTGDEEEWKLAEEKGILSDLEDISGEELYVSVDVDVLDISAMPCCSNPEPMGMAWKELLESLEAIFKNNNVLAADVVEHRPCQALPQYSYAVAWLAYKLFCFKEAYG